METVSRHPEFSDSLTTSDERYHRAKMARIAEAVRPNFLVHWAFILSIFAIPFYDVYVPGTGERLGVKRVVQALIFGAILTRPRVCVRWLPKAFIWFFIYCAYRLVAGIWLAPDYWRIWWPSTLDLLQYLLPWSWFLFNVMRYPKFGRTGLWAFASGVALCAILHIVGIGMSEIDNGAEGRSTMFGQNANEIGEIYAVGIVILVAMALFRNTRNSLRLVIPALAGIVAVALAKSGSRTGAMILAVGVLLLLPQARVFVSRAKRYVIMLLVAVVFAAAMYQVPTVLKRFASMQSESVARDEARGRMAPVLYEIFLRSPVFGTGPDKYQYELTRRAMPYLTEKQQTICAHNMILLLLVETGIVGLILFSLGWSRALLSAWRARSGTNGWLPLALLLPVSLAGLTVSSPIFEPFFWLAIAVALASPFMSPEFQPSSERT